MKFTLTKVEVQSLLAKAMGIPADTVAITAKELAVEVTKNVEDLTFGAVPATTAPVEAETEVDVEDSSEEDTPKAVTKPQAKPKAKAKPVVVEEEIDADEIAEDDDDIDFL